MKIEKNSALLVIDIQQEDFKDLDKNDPRWTIIHNAKRVLDVFRAKNLPVIQVKEVHRANMVDFGRELDGSEDVHCLDNNPDTDYAELTHPIERNIALLKDVTVHSLLQI